MTRPNSTSYTNQLKRTIKTGMNVLGMDDGTYRMMLARVSKSVSGREKNSITKMTVAELQAVLDDMREHGFTPKRGKRPGKSKHNSPRTRDTDNKRPMLGKIHALWISMYKQRIVRDGSDEALNKFARKNVNKYRRSRDMPLVLNINAMTDHELYVLIETLKAWQKREMEKRSKQ